MKTLYQVYAFCEGVWHSPAWCCAVDLTAHPVDAARLRANVRTEIEPKKVA